MRGSGLWVGAMAAALAATAPAGVARAGTGECTLHVWGAGRPNFQPPKSLLVRIDPAQIDRSNPLSSVNLFSTVNRALALPDAELARLFPGADHVTVVRHDTVIDTDRTPLAGLKGPLAPDATGCTGDLIIANLYAIFPNPNAVYETRPVLEATIASLIAGSDRLVIEFWFRDFSGGAAGRVFKRKNDTPLPHVAPMSEEMRIALDASAAANLHGFADWVETKRGK